MNAQTNRLSIVVPVYMGRIFLRELYERVRIISETKFSDFELILVNDASPDNVWVDIVALCKEDVRVKGINLSRNFGQHYAITAGLAYVTGNWVVVMDCDLQDRPEEIPSLYAKAQEGYDSVFAQRTNRQDRLMKRMQSRLFYRLFSYLTDTTMDSSVANYGIYSRKVVNAILAMNDKLRYFPTMVQWVGFRKGYCSVKHDERKIGVSSYSFIKLLKLSLDTIMSFSEKPLRLFVTIGILLTIGSFSLALVYCALAVSNRFIVSGFASIMISLWFVAGVIMTMLGIIGAYLGKVFNQTKNRPIYIVSKTINVAE